MKRGLARYGVFQPEDQGSLVRVDVFGECQVGRRVREPVDRGGGHEKHCQRRRRPGEPGDGEKQRARRRAVTAELIAQKSRGGTTEIALVDAGADKAPAWSPTHFLDAKACPIQQAAVPKQVPSISSYRMAGTRNWLISVSGGVEMDLNMCGSDTTCP